MDEGEAGMHLQLIRVHEDGLCARWKTNPEDLRLILVIPARLRQERPRAS